MRLQHESVNGSVLLALLHDRTNPLQQAQSVYYDLLCAIPGFGPACDILPLLEYMFGREQGSVALPVVLTMSSLLWVMCEVIVIYAAASGNRVTVTVMMLRSALCGGR